MEIKYKFEAVAVTSGLFMLLTAYALPVATYFESFIYYRCFQDLAVQLLLPLVLQMLIPTYAGDNNDDGSILFWILDIVEYLMYFTTIFLTRRVITLLKLM